MTQNNIEQALTRANLAKRLSVSEQTIIKWEKEGMPVERYSSQLIRYIPSKVAAWLEAQSKAQSEARSEA